MRHPKLLACVLGLLLASSAAADTVLCTDGRRFSGDVTSTADGYSVKTKFGVTVDLKSWEVKEWVKEKPAVKPVGGGAAADAGPVNTQGLSAVPKPAGVARPGAGVKTVEALLEFGSTAILAGDYAAARDAFSDALSLDPRSLRAIHGLGLSSLYLNQLQRANLLLQRAIDASGGKPDRALVLNMAMVQIGMNQPLRAVKLVAEYVDAHRATVDEAILSALGSGLFLTNLTGRRNPIWGRSADLFVQYQKVVEGTRPGMKLWGVEWMSAGDVDARLNAMKGKMAEADKVGDRLDAQEGKLLDAKRSVRRMQVGVEKGFTTPASLQQGQVKVKAELAEFNRLAKEYDAACDAIQRPLFPRVLTPVAIDQVAPGPAGEAFASAQKDETYKKALTKAATSRDPGRRSTVEPSDPEGTKPAAPPVVAEAPSAPVVPIRPPAGTKVRVSQQAAAFAVAHDLLITSAATVDGALEIAVQGTDGDVLKAVVVRVDAAHGIALIRLASPDKKLPFFALADKFAGGPVACAAFPDVDLFNPTVAILGGTSEEPKEGWTVKLTRHPRLAGSPLFSNSQVVGVVLANRDAPPDQLPATGPAALTALVGADGGKGLGSRDATSALFQLTAVREVGGK